MPKRKLETPSSRTLRSASSTSSPRSSSSSSPPSKPPVKRTPSKSNKKAYSTKIPADFKSLNDLVTELRADKTAPVDSAGAEVICQQPPLVPIEVYHFQVLIALMLSSQTKDAVVSAAMAKMQTKIPGGLTVQSVSAISDATLDEHIHSVGFHNNKVKYIKKACETIIKDYSGEIPNTSEGLCSLAGVGPKMAHLVMNVAFNEITGIGVDTHMHRIFNILKWVNSSQPDNTRQQLEAWLPRAYWGQINLIWVGFGQESQQQKEKAIKKAIACSRPKEALNLLKRVGVDLKKEAARYEITLPKF